MKIIVDTNILIAAALKGNKPKAVVSHIIADNSLDWIVSKAILTEYKSVLIRPKFKLSKSLQERWFELIDLATTTIEVNLTIDFPRDRKDAKFITCAKAAKAHYLITGDKDFSEAQKLIETKIITAREFLELIKK